MGKISVHPKHIIYPPRDDRTHVPYQYISYGMLCIFMFILCLIYVKLQFLYERCIANKVYY